MSIRAINQRPDVHADPADVIAADLAFAGVQPGAHLDAELEGSAQPIQTAVLLCPVRACPRRQTGHNQPLR